MFIISESSLLKEELFFISLNEVMRQRWFRSPQHWPHLQWHRYQLQIHCQICFFFCYRMVLSGHFQIEEQLALKWKRQVEKLIDAQLMQMMEPNPATGVMEQASLTLCHLFGPLGRLWSRHWLNYCNVNMAISLSYGAAQLLLGAIGLHHSNCL